MGYSAHFHLIYIYIVILSFDHLIEATERKTHFQNDMTVKIGINGM